MEGRRLDRARRDSAKSTAAPTLPSSQDKNFHLRLADLYGQHECLWNTSLPEYQDVEMKRRAWEAIASELGSHLSAAFVRSRISGMRQQLNVYKLQMIEYQMCPGVGKEPEKPYYLESFAFLDTVHIPPESEVRLVPPAEQGVSKQKFVPAQADKSEWRRLQSVKGPERHSEPGPGDSHFTYHNAMSIVKMVKQRLASSQHHLPHISLSRPSSSSLLGSQLMFLDPQVDTPANLRARPGDSISSTKLSTRAREIRQSGREGERARSGERPTTSKPRPTEELGEMQSEEMELYRLHWAVRQQMRSRRPSRPNGPEEPPPPLPQGDDQDPDLDIF